MPRTSFFGAVLYVHSKAGPGHPIVVPAWTAKVFCIRKKQNQAPNSVGSEEVAAAAESQTFHGEPESQAEIDELPTEKGKNAGKENTKATKRKGPQDVKEKSGEDKSMEKPSMQVAEESTGHPYSSSSTLKSEQSYTQQERPTLYFPTLPQHLREFLRLHVSGSSGLQPVNLQMFVTFRIMLRLLFDPCPTFLCVRFLLYFHEQQCQNTPHYRLHHHTFSSLPS